MADPVLQSAEPPALVSREQVTSAFERMFPTQDEKAKKPAFEEEPFEPVEPAKEPAKPEPVQKEAPTEPSKEPEANTDELPEDLGKVPKEQRKDAWKTLREAHKASLREMDALKDQLKEFEGTRKERDEIRARIDSLQTERDQLAQIDSIAKLEHQPQFRAKYIDGRKKAVDKLTELAGYADIDPKELLATLGRTGKDRYSSLTDAVSIAPAVLQNKIVALVDSIYDLDAGREQELSDAQANLGLREQERVSTERERQMAYAENAKKLFTHTAEKLSKELALRPELIERARVLFETNEDPASAAELFIKAVAADDALTERKGMSDKIKSLEAELQKFHASDPGLRSSSGEHAGDGDEKLTFMEKIKKDAAKAGVARS